MIQFLMIRLLSTLIRMQQFGMPLLSSRRELLCQDRTDVQGFQRAVSTLFRLKFFRSIVLMLPNKALMFLEQHQLVILVVAVFY